MAVIRGLAASALFVLKSKVEEVRSFKLSPDY
jgi:hypothetical protein